MSHTGFGEAVTGAELVIWHAGGWHESNGRSYQTALVTGRCCDGCRQVKASVMAEVMPALPRFVGSSDGCPSNGGPARADLFENAVRGDVYGPKRCGVCRARERILDGAWQPRDFAVRR